MEKLDYDYLSRLVERAQNDDSDAFAELYAATYKKEFKFAYQYLRDQFLAQDALQEVYILALKNIKRLHEPKLFVSWLNQINFRVCFDMSKKNKRDSKELADLSFQAEQVQMPGANPEKRVATQDEREYILSKIKELPVDQFKAITMKYYNNMKLEDIATAMDCSLSTVKRLLADGRKALGQDLEIL